MSVGFYGLKVASIVGCIEDDFTLFVWVSGGRYYVSQLRLAMILMLRKGEDLAFGAGQ